MNSKTFSLRLPDDLRNKLQELADADGRSLSNYIVFLLRKAVANERK